MRCFPKPDSRSVMQFHILAFAFLVVHVDLLEERNVRNLVEQFFVILGVLVALRGPLMIVECHAGADHVEQRRAFVSKSGLEKRSSCLGSPANERQTKLQPSSIASAQISIAGRSFT